METAKVTASWLHTNKADLSTILKITHDVEDIFIRPDVEEIVNEERSVLLTHPETENEEKIPCVLQFEVQPAYKISALSLASTAKKIEVYIGPLLEYMETYFGEEVEENFSYVYHIEIQRSGITHLELKFIGSEESVCIFGAIMQIAPNPNGITTQQNINFENVEEILKQSHNMPPAQMQKCKLFMQMMNKKDIVPRMATCGPLQHSPGQRESMEVALKKHIDLRLSEFESKLNNRLDQIEHKFTQLFKMLEKEEMS